ncbi:MAG: xylan 1,4-beta-xylosidase [Oscillospiraceae bacterium]|nr:xylan 1,4-beta-xylosidase [Oscillospiraceae bacterium]
MDLTNETQVLIDVATGVNYMYHQNGYSGGLTVLVDGEGHPIVTPRELLPQYQG